MVARDVTEQRRTGQRLRDQQNYSRALIESALDALLATDTQLNITDVNDKTIQMTGYTREELLRSSLPSLFADAELAAEAARKALDELVKDYELTIRTAAGGDVAVSFNASPFKDAQGRVRGVFASARDIGERRRLERERSLLASIVTSSEDAIYSETPEGIVTSCRTAGRKKLLGYCGAGNRWPQWSPSAFPSGTQGGKPGPLAAGSACVKTAVQQFETVRRRKDGNLVDVSITMLADNTDKAGGVGVALPLHRARHHPAQALRG